MRGGRACGISANEYSCAHGAQINLGDITPPYLTYDSEYPCGRVLCVEDFIFKYFCNKSPISTCSNSDLLASRTFGEKSWCTLLILRLGQVFFIQNPRKFVSIDCHHRLVEMVKSKNSFLFKQAQNCRGIFFRDLFKDTKNSGLYDSMIPLEGPDVAGGGVLKYICTFFRPFI